MIFPSAVFVCPSSIYSHRNRVANFENNIVNQFFWTLKVLPFTPASRCSHFKGRIIYYLLYDIKYLKKSHSFLFPAALTFGRWPYFCEVSYGNWLIRAASGSNYHLSYPWQSRYSKRCRPSIEQSAGVASFTATVTKSWILTWYPFFHPLPRSIEYSLAVPGISI